MRPRLLAGGVALAWIAASMALLVAFRGVPLRVRGGLVGGSLLALLLAIAWLRRTRRKQKTAGPESDRFSG